MNSDEELEREVADLYSQSLDDFVERRSGLAARLQADGDAEGAAGIRALRKPVRSAWAVNRLVREDGAGVEGLVEVGDRLRAAQRRALSGASADELRERSEERRRLVTALTQEAVEILGGGEPPASIVEDIAATLEAASIDEEAARLVLSGRLTKPLPRPAGFGDVTGLRSVESAEREEPPRPSAAEERAEQRRRERELRAAEERERRARARVDRLRAEVEELQGRLAKKKDELRAREADARGAAVEAKRLRR